jgi:hypothetical protein
MRKYRDGVVMTDPIRRHAIGTRVLVAIVAAGLLTAALAGMGAARPHQAVCAASAAETVVPRASVERSGSIAAYPPVY